jgi:pimeloyl-ACP methyl ester carboxylesterase
MRLLPLLFSAALSASAAGRYLEVSYPPGDLPIAARYTMWVPDTAKPLRAVIVHQHGCGAPAARGGSTAAFDLHWQALAAKWDAALLAPYYMQTDDKLCRQWSDPRNGSEKVFLRAIADFAARLRRAELKEAPWVLWGHSGGGTWVGIMTLLHPERVAAVWYRSGAPMAETEIPEAVFFIPAMTNAGVKERECADSRYLAIPFLDAAMAMRLPARGGKLRKVSQAHAWLAQPLGDTASPADSFRGDRNESVWLPNASVAKAWAEYVKTGAVSDRTPPPAPSVVTATRAASGAVEISWRAEADFESGIQSFLILRDGVRIAQVPETPKGRFGRPLFQPMSYHDTPEAPVPELHYTDREGGKHVYMVVTVNSVGLRSKPSKPARAVIE